jgi:hypothetical protein
VKARTASHTGMQLESSTPPRCVGERRWVQMCVRAGECVGDWIHQRMTGKSFVRCHVCANIGSVMVS